ncbi:hypothetical protein RPMA_18450 [Tardiphaga alba]|uniref:Uncharacterized protein n=1 Tax=Tardiphaga alba TaxID=340268 RepID=A0ABX8AA18_9BRAD|nr:hypothetical protein [Tardiphaga alba]QUS40598.1 hypothetical protein RPMA_18450 [Tardiphaga alba]
MPRRNTCNRLPGVTSTLPPSITISALIDNSTVSARPDLRGKAAVEQMADDMRQFGQREGGVSRDDLELLGWTSQQVDLHSSDARTLALRLSRVAA